MGEFVRRGARGAGTGRLAGAALSLTIALSVAGSALAEGGNLSGCEEQAQRLCRSLSDDGARERCLLQRELECEDSGPSNVTRRRVRDRSAQMRNACRADFERVCADLGNDASRTAILACLREHRDEVSDPCRMALSLEAEDLLLGREEIDPESGKRVCVLILSNEISRARGGPHCLVHPLVRDDLT